MERLEHSNFPFCQEVHWNIHFCLSTAFSTRHNIDSDWLSSLGYFVLIAEANVLRYVSCNCLCSSYAAYAWGSIFYEVISSVGAHQWQHLVLSWPYEFLPLGIEKLLTNTLLCFSRILWYIYGSGWHQQEWSCLEAATRLWTHHETAPLHPSYCPPGYIIFPLHRAVWLSHTLRARLISHRKHSQFFADNSWSLFHTKFSDVGSFNLCSCCRTWTHWCYCLVLPVEPN